MQKETVHLEMICLEFFNRNIGAVRKDPRKVLQFLGKTLEKCVLESVADEYEKEVNILIKCTIDVCVRN